MSVPTAQLQDLQISGGMPPRTRSGGNSMRAVLERAIVVRDVLSSFEENCLPSEYMPDVYQSILEHTRIDVEPRMSVRQGDLRASLFRVGAYYEEAFPCIQMMQSVETLSRIYCEKLKARFATLFGEYDELAPTSTNPDPQGKVNIIVQNLLHYNLDALNDRTERRRRESPTDTLGIDRRFASMLIEQLHALCNRSKLGDSDSEGPVTKKAKTTSKSASKAPSTRSPKMSSKRTSLGSGQKTSHAIQSQMSYLFREILGKASTETGFFALDLLGKCSVESLKPQQRGLRELQILLESGGASQGYQEIFGKLVTPEEENQ